MSTRTYTEEQRTLLRSNPNVINCTRGVIIYNKDFRVRAVQQYHDQGWGPKQIFQTAGFNIKLIGQKTPAGCLRAWNKKYKLKGLVGLREKRSGGRVKTKDMSATDRIKWLEAKVTYLKAENDFLAKLRAKRAE